MGCGDVLFVFGLLALSGCASDDAILEVGLTLDAASECERFVRVEAVSGADGFDAPWPESAQVDTLPLEAEAHLVRFSLIAEANEARSPVHLRALVCRDASCNAEPTATCPADGEGRALYVEVERAFYVGHYTGVTIDLADARAELPRSGADVRIGRCDVSGCVIGAATTYCDEGGLGPHFCE